MAFFGYFLSTRKESNPPEAKGKRQKERKILHGRTESSAPTHVLMCRVSVPCLSLWERWPSAARTERANNDHLVLLFKKAARPSQSPAVTALPKGEPRVCTPLYRRIPRRREAVRPYARPPYLRLALSFRGREAPVGIRPPRLPLRGRCHGQRP